MDPVIKSFRKLTLWVIFLILSFTLSPAAQADVIYTYTGNSFVLTNLPPNYTNISGSLTFAAPLAPDDPFPFAPPLPASYSFTDGVNVFTPNNSTIHMFDSFSTSLLIPFTTDPTGAIKTWNIELIGFTIPYATLHTYYDPQGPVPIGIGIDEVSTEAGGYAYIPGAPGTWTGPATVPEPGILVLLGISMASILGLKRWWKE